MLFFFKQKTAYEMYHSDWSSDVCSSDLCEDAPEAWEAALEAMCGDAALRERLGRAAHDDVRAHWMLEPNAHRWPQLYETLLLL